MKILLTVVVLSYVLYEGSAGDISNIRIEKPHDLRRPGGCYHDDFGHVIPSVKTQRQGKCELITCQSDGTLFIKSCHYFISERENCVARKEDANKYWPHCCARLCSNTKV
ncbi:hypothetical protein TcasGA2_TC032413 [Tribolium castaneum]|uniref:Single domain-containing protein n=1 Tax=Tribolium castaneum TaxID=7070 RepID=A0A139WKV6_TRICA|nr:PREDICTED: uncharacterized protein LOC103312351 [Tribolium castaneum]KYB28698.1 hypothetical protein TcasGA2_TC032413 [Tribolium castaneum]|eukprot:XP_015833328.1 PREDICTED: uncharacterized protein LOC103312351 [Tribolium castaneum]